MTVTVPVGKAPRFNAESDSIAKSDPRILLNFNSSSVKLEYFLLILDLFFLRRFFLT